jgi:hypothetical protein
VRGGDRVTEVAGRVVGDLAALAEALADAGGGPVPVAIERDGRRRVVRIPPDRAVVTRVIPAPRAVMASRLPAPGELSVVETDPASMPSRPPRKQPAPESPPAP